MEDSPTLAGWLLPALTIALLVLGTALLAIALTLGLARG